MTSASLDLDGSAALAEAASPTAWALPRIALRLGRTGLVALRASAALARAADPVARSLRLRDACREVLAAHRIEVRLRGSLPRGPALVVANHVSWLDPLVLLAQAPCAAVAKAEVEGWPVVGPVGRSAGALFLRRGDAHSGARTLRGMLRALSAGVAVLNFPEGTTTEGSDVLAFRTGSFGIARRAGVPVVPVALRYVSPGLSWTGGDSFVPHYLKVAGRAGCAVEVSACPALPAGLSDEETSARARDAIRSVLREAA